MPSTPKPYDTTDKPLNHYSPSYLSSGKDSYISDQFSSACFIHMTFRNQLPGLYNNEDISYPNIQRPAYPFYLSPLNKVVDESEDNRSLYPPYSVCVASSLSCRPHQAAACATDTASTIPRRIRWNTSLPTLPL